MATLSSSFTGQGRVAQRLIILAISILSGLSIAVLPLESTVAIVVVLTGLWSGLKRPDLAIACIAASIPVQTLLSLDLGFASFTLTKVIVWTALTGWLWSEVWGRRRFALDSVSLGLLAVGLALLFSGWNAADGGLLIGEVYRWLIAFPVAVMAMRVYSNGWSVRPLLVSCALATIVCSGYAAWQVVEEIGPPSFESRGLMRATGPFSHPNQLALYLETTTPLLVSLAILGLSTLRFPIRLRAATIDQLLALTAASSGIVALLLSQSRGGGAGMAAGLAAVATLWIGFRHRPVVWFAMAGIAGLMALAIATIVYLATGVATVSARETLVNPANFAVEERLAHWIAGVRMALNNEWLGIGAGNFDKNFREATSDWRFRIGRGHAHNSYIHMLAQAGMVGFASYMLLVAVIGMAVSRAVECARRSDVQAIAIGIAGISTAVFVHAFFEYVHVLSINLQLAIVWGLASAIARTGDRTESFPQAWPR